MTSHAKFQIDRATLLPAMHRIAQAAGHGLPDPADVATVMAYLCLIASENAPGVGSRTWRRMMLRQIRWMFYPGLARTNAGRAIAVAWAEHKGAVGPFAPGSIGEAFARLERAGVRPLKFRQIQNDLDPDLDGPGPRS